jgi:hypothetical protein
MADIKTQPLGLVEPILVDEAAAGADQVLGNAFSAP